MSRVIRREQVVARRDSNHLLTKIHINFDFFSTEKDYGPFMISFRYRLVCTFPDN
jgi:hypothetical protein